jgi:5-methylcytosine-specific restriction endonuclease McrA
VEDFCSSLIRNKKTYLPATFTWEDLVERLGDDPRCYLTGKQLNLDDPSSFQIDHIQPRSRGGDNSLENCGIASKDANQCKRDLTVEEFYLLCKGVVNNLKDQFE